MPEYPFILGGATKEPVRGKVKRDKMTMDNGDGKEVAGVGWKERLWNDFTKCFPVSLRYGTERDKEIRKGKKSK